MLRKSARQSQKEHARSTRDFNERETKRVSGRSTRSRRDNTRQNTLSRVIYSRLVVVHHISQLSMMAKLTVAHLIPTT